MRVSAVETGARALASGLLGSGRVAVGGHRGRGENILSSAGGGFKDTLTFRENTIPSFRQVIHDGASFVEFDVQVTRDNVPILFHDDWIEWGAPDSFTSKRIADMTVSDLKGLSKADGSQSPMTRRTRAEADLSWCDSRGAWHCVVDDELPTLQELFQSLPASAAFNLEVKMTTGLGITSAEEVDRVVNPILETVHEHAGARSVVFSSFDPDVCIALSERQSLHDVLFLTCCQELHPDPRQRSVPASIEVAKKHKLLGVVADTENLRACPELITAVKSQGLYLASYGRSNDKAEWVHEQVSLGIDAVIADDISGALSVADGKCVPAVYDPASNIVEHADAAAVSQAVAVRA